MSVFSLPWSIPPRMIICLARSYGKHALELGNPIPESPLYFLKAPSAIIHHQDSIIIPTESQEVHYEAEAALWIAHPLSHATLAEAEASIAGWTLMNDVTARDLQRADKGRFTRAKGFDTFCPLLKSCLPLSHWSQCRIQGWHNQKLKQDAPLSDMLYTPAEVLVALSKVMHLMPGDLISLGTPSGVGALKSGDSFEVRLVDEQGKTLLHLQNPVIDAS
jgi:2-keto-4-pentenoate hydratase/2-oxohepta-3-ene-1,7-dioic acid hydratase in catechol pathway